NAIHKERCAEFSNAIHKERCAEFSNAIHKERCAEFSNAIHKECCAEFSLFFLGGGKIRKIFLYQKNILFASKKTHSCRNT
ncbi:hypothetical protein, partial [Leptospira interrogans]|uniref:hypothetical protein n=1 Tax=Leptospira interrogans TaxID=173 RepID=UPI003C13017D|nr:hypothetical protein [Leptospira interrogans serovar Canicola]